MSSLSVQSGASLRARKRNNSNDNDNDNSFQRQASRAIRPSAYQTMYTHSDQLTCSRTRSRLDRHDSIRVLVALAVLSLDTVKQYQQSTVTDSNLQLHPGQNRRQCYHQHPWRVQPSALVSPAARRRPKTSDRAGLLLVGGARAGSF